MIFTEAHTKREKHCSGYQLLTQGHQKEQSKMYILKSNKGLLQSKESMDYCHNKGINI